MNRNAWITFFFLVLGFVLTPKQEIFAQKKKNKSKPETSENLTSKVSDEKKEQIDFYFHEALTKKSLKEFKESIKLFQEVLKLDPKHHASLYNIADIYFDLNDAASAEKYAVQAAELDPNNVWYLRLLSLVYDKLQKTEKSIQVLEKNLHNFPGDIELRFQLAELLIHNAQYRKAIDVYDSIQNHIGVSEEISVQKHRIYLLLNEPEKAIEEIQALIQSYPYEAKHYHTLYELYLKTNNQQLAIQTLENLLKISPDETLAVFKIAEFYRNQNNSQKELEYLKMAFSNPKITIEIKTEYLMEMMTKDTTEENRKKIIELASYIKDDKGNEGIAWALKGDVAFFGNQPDSSYIFYHKSLKANELNQIVWNRLLELDTKMSWIDTLKKDAEAAIEIFPNEPVFLYYSGFANYELKNYENSIRRLEKLIKLIDANDQEMIHEVQNLLANAYFYHQNYKKSFELCEKILENDPDNLLTLNNYAYFLSLKGEKLDKALQMILKVIEKEPNNPSYQDTYGWVLYKMNDFENAKNWIEKSYHAKKSPDVIEHLGDVYFQLGDKEKALELWKEAQKAGSKSSELGKKIQTGTL